LRNLSWAKHRGRFQSGIKFEGKERCALHEYEAQIRDHTVTILCWYRQPNDLGGGCHIGSDTVPLGLLRLFQRVRHLILVRIISEREFTGNPPFLIAESRQ
jgi:hypothetical protein